MKYVTAFAALLLLSATAALADSTSKQHINLASTVTLGGQFSFYSTTTQLNFLVVGVPAGVEPLLVYVECATDDPTGCDELGADEGVMVFGHLSGEHVCDDGSELHYYNKVVPDVVMRCDENGCEDLAAD